MYYFAQVCRTCIKNNEKLINIHDLDRDSVSFYEKLTLCLPTMTFEETSIKTYLCQNCSDILRKMYDFRELCINSERTLNTYILQLEQTNFFQTNKQNNLIKLLDSNYIDLTTISNEMPKSLEIKLEKYDSDNDTEIIKTETLDFEYVEVERPESNYLIDIKNEPLDIKPDCHDYIVSEEGTDEQDEDTNTNKDFNIQSPNTSGSSRTKPTIEHEQTDTSEKRYKCDVCSKSFCQASYVQKHMLIHTGERPYVCDVCNKTFNRIDVLRSHKRIHTGNKPHVCDICSKRFYSSGSLQIHNRIHTGEKPFVCDICNKGFSTLGPLQRHKRYNHMGENLYECDVCNKKFNGPSYLYKHKQIHTGEKPYKCDVCSKSFIRLDQLQKHKRIHTGEKPYECDICNKRFNQATTLQTHKRTHTGEKPYECNVCNKTFNQSGTLLVHKRIHTGEKH